MMSNVPEIRLKGFDDAWEQRKLGAAFEQTSDLNTLLRTQ